MDLREKGWSLQMVLLRFQLFIVIIVETSPVHLSQKSNSVDYRMESFRIWLRYYLKKCFN